MWKRVTFDSFLLPQTLRFFWPLAHLPKGLLHPIPKSEKFPRDDDVAVKERPAE